MHFSCISSNIGLTITHGTGKSSNISLAFADLKVATYTDATITAGVPASFGRYETTNHTVKAEETAKSIF